MTIFPACHRSCIRPHRAMKAFNFLDVWTVSKRKGWVLYVVCRPNRAHGCFGRLCHVIYYELEHNFDTCPIVFLHAHIE